MSENVNGINLLEEGTELQLDFSKIAKAVCQSPDIIPVAVQNIDTKEVILIAYTNEYAMKKSFETRMQHSGQRLEMSCGSKGKALGILLS